MTWFSETGIRGHRVRYEHEEGHMGIKILLTVYENVEMLELNLECLRIMSGAGHEDVVIIDMGTDREVTAWVERQKEWDYVCAEGLENYARILNTAIAEFSADEDVMLLNSNLVCLGDCVRRLSRICGSDGMTGAVIPSDFAEICPEKVDIAQALDRIGRTRRERGEELAMKIPFQCVYMARRFINDIGPLDESLLLPDNVMLDYSLRGISEKWKLITVPDAFVYEMVPYADVYAVFLGADADRESLKAKWDMNYFNGVPNEELIRAIERRKDEVFSVLEVGCDCGVNLMRIRNEYPEAALFGMEINPGAARIASEFGDVVCGNVEDGDLPYEDGIFDYILFGDVLEHLRDPEKVVGRCRRLLRAGGKIIASIPNLMHYGVLRSLIGGDFAYQDTGLLDRTHIHFFTYNEIVRMFWRQGYKIDSCTYNVLGNMKENDRRYVAELAKMGGGREFMYLAYQYLVVAGPAKETDTGRFLPRFRSDEETIRLITQEGMSLGRFGDGEFAIAFDIPRQKFQRPDPGLRDRIRQVLTQTDNPALLIGIADHYGGLERFNAQAARGIRMYLTDETRAQHMSLLSPDRVYSDTYMTRPYVIHRDVFTDGPRGRFESLKKIWEGRRVIIVEGAQTRLGVGNDLLGGAAGVRRILAPATDSFDRYEDILAVCEECREMAEMFLLAIGPSSGVLAYDLSRRGIQAVDVGHVDLEYEWFLAGKGTRVEVPNKYNNEFAGGDKVSDADLPENYYEEIIADLSDRVQGAGGMG